jgi:hypothetical protein
VKGGTLENVGLPEKIENVCARGLRKKAVDVADCRLRSRIFPEFLEERGQEHARMLPFTGGMIRVEYAMDIFEMAGFARGKQPENLVGKKGRIAR